jgi:hypothetical protein
MLEGIDDRDLMICHFWGNSCLWIYAIKMLLYTILLTPHVPGNLYITCNEFGLTNVAGPLQLGLVDPPPNPSVSKFSLGKPSATDPDAVLIFTLGKASWWGHKRFCSTLTKQYKSHWSRTVFVIALPNRLNERKWKQLILALYGVIVWGLCWGGLFFKENTFVFYYSCWFVVVVLTNLMDLWSVLKDPCVCRFYFVLWQILTLL